MVNQMVASLLSFPFCFFMILFLEKKMSDYLPPEVLTTIFARLSVNTLLQCSFVCQSWHSLISSPSFIDANLSWQKRDLFFVRSYSIEKKEKVYGLHFDNENLTKHSDVDFPFSVTFNNRCRIVGICNGVVCLSDGVRYTNKTFLWNPSIGKGLRLPQLRLSLKYGAIDGVTGFGFDPNSNDYKVVMITCYNNFRVADEVNVFSLKSGSWRNISLLEPKIQQIVCHQAPQVYFNGAVHWIASDLRVERNVILSFKMNSEALQTLELPSTIPFISPPLLNSILKPAVVEGSLAFVEGGGIGFCIWMMTEYGVCSSWTKKVVVFLGIPVDRLIALKRNGELIFDSRGVLFSYDPEAGKEFNPRSLGEKIKLFKLVNSYLDDWLLSGGFPPMLTGLKKLGISNRYAYYHSLTEQSALHIESYQESLVLLGTQAYVEDNETESEEEKAETESMDDETESKVEADNWVVAGENDQIGQASNEMEMADYHHGTHQYPTICKFWHYPYA